MAATVTSGNVFLEPTDIFRHYDGPPKPKRIRKRNQTPGRKVDPSPDIPFTDIDDILRSDLAEPDLVPELGGDAVEGGSQDNPITIEESGSDTDTDSDSDSELPALEELLVRRHSSNKEASVASAAENRIIHGGTWPAVGHQDDGSVHDGDAMRPAQRSGGELGAHASSEAAVGSLPTPTTVVITKSGDSPRPEDGDGSGGDDVGAGGAGGATGTGLPHVKQRKRPHSPSTVDSTVYDLGTPDPDHDSRLSKRQRLHLRSASESTPTRSLTPTPNPDIDLSQSSATSSDDTHNKIGIEQPSTECNGEAKASTVGIGGSDTSDHAKTAERECSDELLQSIEPTTQRVRAVARRHRTKPSRTAALAISSAQRSPTEPMVQRTPDPETRSPAAEPSPVPPPRLHRPAHSAAREGTAHLESHGHDGTRSIQYPPPEVTEMFVAVTIQTAGDMLQMSSNEPARLIENASAYAGKTEDVTIKPLGPAGAWQVSGRLRLHNDHLRNVSRPAAGHESTPGGGNHSWDLRKRARALCEGAAYDAEAACATDTKGDGVLNGYHRRSHDGGRGDGDDGSGSDDDDDDDDDHDGYDDDGHEVTRRRNRRWDPLDDQRLLAWRKEEKPWKWIFDQFPYRTEPAVRVRWHLLQRASQRVD